MPKQSTLRKIVLTIAFGASAAFVAAAPAGAHGRGGGGSHSGGYSGGFVNTIHPIVRSPIINTIHPIIATSPIVRDHRIGLYGVGTLAPPTGPIVRDHRGGSQGEGGVTITSVPRPPSSSSLCIVSCGAYLGTPTYYNAGNTIRDHRTNPFGYGN
jgi:hypothetical protein